MSDALKQRVRAIVVGLAPLVLAAGFILQPYVADLTDSTELAAAVEAGVTRWAWSLLLIALGLVLIILAVFAIRLHLRNAGEEPVETHRHPTDHHRGPECWWPWQACGVWAAMR